MGLTLSHSGIVSFYSGARDAARAPGTPTRESACAPPLASPAKKGPASHLESDMQAIIVSHLYGMGGGSILRHGRVSFSASILRLVTEAGTEGQSRVDGASRAPL
jgi:hypothetical protein